MSPRDRWILCAFFVLAALGFVLPFWPLSALGVALIALWGRWLIALFIGLLLDLAWGAPLGLFHIIYFPFALLAVVAALARLLGAKYFINRNPPEHL
jgi:hypothetical protein